MTKPKTLRSAASMILVTTALAWGLPVRADDMRTLESEREGAAGAHHQQDSARGDTAAGMASDAGPDSQGKS